MNIGETTVTSLLIKWNLQEVAEIFEENGIDMEAFRLLTDETIAELITKVGPRLKFKERFKNYVKEIQDSNNIENVPDDLNCGTGSSTSTVTSDFEDSQLMPPPPGPLPVLPPIIFEDSFENIQENQPENIYVLESLENISQAKRVRTSIFPNGLESLLKDNVDGNLILENKNKFNNDIRQKLVKIIVDFLYHNSSCGRILPSTFMKATEEIISLFPKEQTATYYIPYKKKTNTSPKLIAKGRLYSKYMNLKKSLRDSKLRCSSSSGSTTEDDFNETTNIDENDDEIEAMLNFLALALEPYEKIEFYYKKTSKKRQLILKSKSIAQYFDQIPYLKQPTGYLLILQDFKFLYPDKENKLFNIWSIVAPRIIELSVKYKKVINCDITDINNLAIITLPYLFPSVTLNCHNKNKRKKWRPSKLEVQESFFLYLKTPGELEEVIENRRKKAAENGFSVQPFCVTIGNTCTSNYAIIDSQVYKLGTPLSALDLLFKIFFSLKLEYPMECKQIWTFIQKVLFDINTEYDINYPAVNSLKTDLDIF